MRGLYANQIYCRPIEFLVMDLEEYIRDELRDSRYYYILSIKAPTQRARELLLEFSRDERMHAENFMNAYYRITGRTYRPPIIEDPTVPDYEEALKERILAETADYKKHGEQYLCSRSTYFKDLFFMTRTVEAQHAMRIPLLLEEEAD